MLRTKECFIAKKDLEELRRIQKPTKVQELICKVFCILFRQYPVRKRKNPKLLFNPLAKIEDGYVELQHFPVLKNILINKTYRVFIKDFNIYFLTNEVKKTKSVM